MKSHTSNTFSGIARYLNQIFFDCNWRAAYSGTNLEIWHSHALKYVNIKGKYHVKS